MGSSGNTARGGPRNCPGIRCGLPRSFPDCLRVTWSGFSSTLTAWPARCRWQRRRSEGLEGCFALAQAGRLFRCLQGGRDRSQACEIQPLRRRALHAAGEVAQAERGAGRADPRRREPVSHEPPGLEAARSCGADAGTPAAPGRPATVALNLLRPGGAGFGGPTIVVDPRGELWCVTAQRTDGAGPSCPSS